MKIRFGFVSNSSSSSFLAVGIGERTDIKKYDYFSDILDKINYDQDEYYYKSNRGILKKGEFTLYGYNKVFFVGIDATKLIYTMNGREMIALFKEKVKRLLNIDIPESYIEIKFGDVEYL